MVFCSVFTGFDDITTVTVWLIKAAPFGAKIYVYLLIGKLNWTIYLKFCEINIIQEFGIM
jgi:hypothetical protein